MNVGDLSVLDLVVEQRSHMMVGMHPEGRIQAQLQAGLSRGTAQKCRVEFGSKDTFVL